MKKYFLGIVIALTLALTPVYANIVVNGSFETPASVGNPSLPDGSTYLTGWTVVTAEIAQVNNFTFAGIYASDGSYSLDLTGYHDSAPYGGVTQTLTTTPGTVYDVMFDVGAISGTDSVQISVGDLVDFGASTSATTSDVWTTYSGSFTASSVSTSLTLQGVSPSSGGTYIGLDNVIVTPTSATTPEPSSLLLGAFALLSLPLLRRYAR